MLGIDRKTLFAIRNRHPEHPRPSDSGVHRVDDWQKWIDTLPETKPDNELPEDAVALKIQKAKLEIRKLKADSLKREIANDERTGKLLNRDAVLQTITAAVTGARDLLSRKMLNEWPSLLAGMTATEIAERLKSEEEQVHIELRKMFLAVPNA